MTRYKLTVVPSVLDDSCARNALPSVDYLAGEESPQAADISWIMSGRVE